MDNFDLKGFVRDFKNGENPYDKTQPINESKETPTPKPSPKKKPKINNFLTEVENKLKGYRNNKEGWEQEEEDDSDKFDGYFDDSEEGDPYDYMKYGGFMPDEEDIFEGEDSYEAEIEALLGEGSEEEEEDFYDPALKYVEEAKKDDEEEEPKDEGGEDLEGEDLEGDDMDMDWGNNLDSAEEIQDHLQQALKISREMGDDKLSDQIGNTITFLTRQSVKDGVEEQKKKVTEVSLKDYPNREAAINALVDDYGKSPKAFKDEKFWTLTRLLKHIGKLQNQGKVNEMSKPDFDTYYEMIQDKLGRRLSDREADIVFNAYEADENPLKVLRDLRGNW